LQTKQLAALGCEVRSLELSGARGPPPPAAACIAEIAAADVIIISGGNSLFMLDAWKKLGVDALLRGAAARGCVFGGGSAGLGWIFDALHSDSADTSTYLRSVADGNEWRYIRVPALGLLPGLCVPHYDTTQSNGVPRAMDVEPMLLRTREAFIGVDNWAALRIADGGFEVLSVPGKQRACGEGAPPYVWLGRVEAGAVVVRPAPARGALAELGGGGGGPAAADDADVARCRAENPLPF
jgi:dipeptidase E